MESAAGRHAWFFEATARAVWEGAIAIPWNPDKWQCDASDRQPYLHSPRGLWKPSLLLWEIDHIFVGALARTCDLITAPKKAGFRSLRPSVHPLTPDWNQPENVCPAPTTSSKSATFSIDANGKFSADIDTQ